MSREPIWIKEPRFCEFCGEQIIPTYYMAPTRWHSGRVKYCSRECKARNDFPIYWGKPLSPETCEKISKTKRRQGKWAGKDNPNFGGKISTGRSNTLEQKIASRRRMLNGGAAKARRAQGGKRSSLEIAVEEIFIKNNIPFKTQYLVENHCADFYIPPNFIIECDGSYWHSLPEQQLRDRQNNIMMRKNGFRILRISEQDIRKRLDCCEERILSFLSLSITNS